MRTEVDAHIDRFFDQQCARAARYDLSYQQLWDALRRVSHGGKRIRPQLVQSTYQALGGQDHQSAVEVGIAFEFLHTAFVIHDDIIDGDTVRRGEPNVTGLFLEHAAQAHYDSSRARHWGESAALIGGDLMITHAQLMLSRLEVSHDIRLQLLDLFEEAVFDTAAGEHADVTFSLQGPEGAALERVIEMAEQKTASYSFEQPLRAGAVLAGASAELAATIGEFGRVFGTAYQLRDDYLGLFGESTVTGKSVLSDLREGKTTPIMVFAHKTPAWDMIETLRHRAEITHEQHLQVLAELEQYGAKQFLADLESDYIRRAHELTADPGVPPAVAQELRRTMAALSQRAF